MGPLADGVTSEHYGEIADDPTFNLKRISPTGETLDNHTVESTESETYLVASRRCRTNTTTRRPRSRRILPCERAGQRHAGLRVIKVGEAAIA